MPTIPAPDRDRLLQTVLDLQIHKHGTYWLISDPSLRRRLLQIYRQDVEALWRQSQPVVEGPPKRAPGRRVSPGSYAAELRTLRHTQGLTQAAFAERLGIARDSYQRLETGYHSVPETTIRLARLLAAAETTTE